MEFRHLEAFAAVVSLGSFSKASERLFLTQPTISAHIQSLEEELGVKLLLRTTREIHLSPQGKAFYPYVRRLLKLRDEATSAATQSRKEVPHDPNFPAPTSGT